MKNYNKDNPPISCKCGCEETVKKHCEFIPGEISSEPCAYILHCKECGSYLGSFEYGRWSY